MTWTCLALDLVTDRDALLSPEAIEQLAARVRDVLELRLDTTQCHRFEPVGFSFVAFGAPGRLAIHTWPEHRFATIDVWLATPHLHVRSRSLVAMLDAAGYRTAADCRELRVGVSLDHG